MTVSQDLYLSGVALTFLIAFSSLYIQLPGLYGEKGLLPAGNVIQREPQSISEFLDQPTLLRYRYRYWLDTESAMDVVCVSGIILSFLATVYAPMRTTLVYAILWILYMSMYSVGQTFLWFQWDILLLEAGFLAMIVAPLQILGLPSKHHHDNVTMWLVKWLLFRLMFASGVVKLQSHCDTWWSLTALDWHFESQCIPTPLAWYFHHTPQWFRMFSNASVFVIQIAVSFLFFAPTKTLRMFSFYAQVSLQLLILMTGNYNFFNLLTIVLCFSLIDDYSVHRPLGRGARKQWQKTLNMLKSSCGTLLNLTAFAVLAVFSYKYFSFSISDGVIFSKINFTKQGFAVYVYYATGVSIWVAISSLLWEISTALYKSVTVEKGFVKVFYSVFSTVVMSSVVIFMFCISLVPHTVIERSIQSKLPPQIFRWHQQTDNLQLVNSYGLFRRMTGVGGRPEVIVFGSNDKVNWKEYTFLYKPGQLERRPPVVAPHQPRLDWQMWFAALGSYQHNHWFIVMLYRLLENEPTVLSLMQDNPFPHQPPKYIKAQLFTYHFSAISTRRKWWERDDYPQEYTPILTKDDKNLVAYLTQNNILPGRKRYAPYGKLDSGMRSIRAVVEGIDPALFVFSLSFLAIVNLVLLKLLRF